MSPHPPERKSWCSTGIAVEHTPLVGALALHGVSGQPIGSHLGSTLKPGRAVLTRGVFRRSGSVACVHADASPTEVLTDSYVCIAIGARQHTVEEAVLYIDTFIATPFSFEERHERRIAQLAEYETTGLIAGREID